MLPVNLLNTLKELASGQKSLPAAAADTSPQITKFEPGQKIQGIVQTQISPGLFNVRVGDQLTQMPLPSFIRTGDTIKLQVVATHPRLTFSMSASANPLSTDEKLSSVARLLSALSQQPREKTDMHAVQSTPIWTTPDTMKSTQLAELLTQAVNNSGLFYESHQAQWLKGARSTSQLMQEPQNSPTANSSTSVEKSVIPSSNMSASNQQNIAASAEDKMPIIPDHLQSLVQQQIGVLESRQVFWEGNIWPNQTMRWEIHEDDSPAPSAEAQKRWSTQIHLDLPNLGMISATLSFDNAGLSLKLNTSSAAARTTLGNASSQLVNSMSDCGIPIISTIVTQNEPA
jgi:hypothetical protein